MDKICDKAWKEILSSAQNWKESGRELKTLGKGRKATGFTIIQVTTDYLKTSALPYDRYSKEIFCRAVQLLYKRGESGAELRPTKTSYPTPGSIDYEVRPPKSDGKIPSMRATWIGAILVRSGVATIIEERPIKIRLRDRYLTQ